MAQGCDTDCVRTNLGFRTQAEYITNFGNGCLGAQQDVFCVNGQPAVAPRGCTTVFGEARHDNGATVVPASQFPTTPSTQFDPSIGTSTPLEVTNDTCYPMNLTFNLNGGVQMFVYAVEPDSALTSVVWVGFDILIDGVPLGGGGFGAGGGGVQLGNDANPHRAIADSYTVFSPTPLAPGDTITVTVVPGLFVTNQLDPATQINSWVSAARVTGTTICPT